MASTSSVQTQKTDPVVLGVSVPVQVTLGAVKQVADAWQKFGLDFAQAVTHLRDKKAPPKSKAEKDGMAESSAAPAAGVNA